MPRRKTLPQVSDYIDADQNSNETASIQETNPLMTLSETGMKLPELRLLDMYLSHIDSNDPNNRLVRIDKEELQKILGDEYVKRDNIKKRLKGLFQVVTVRNNDDDDDEDSFMLISLFERAKLIKDDDDKWHLDLSCTREAMEHVFTPENTRYLRYRLKNVVRLTSRYSYILYMYLENNRFRESWTVSIEELRDILGCGADTYKQFHRFNDLVLKPCKMEIIGKTNLIYMQETLRKKGGRANAVRFTVLQNVSPETAALLTHNKHDKDALPALPEAIHNDKPNEEDVNKTYKSEADIKSDGQNKDTAPAISAPPRDDAKEVDKGKTDVTMVAYRDDVYSVSLAEACENQFTDMEMIVIFCILSDHCVGSRHRGQEVDRARYRYLSEMYQEFKRREESSLPHGQPLGSRFRVFQRMLENDTTYVNY